MKSTSEDVKILQRAPGCPSPIRPGVDNIAHGRVPFVTTQEPTLATTSHWTPDFISVALVFPCAWFLLPDPVLTFGRHVPLAFPGL